MKTTVLFATTNSGKADEFKRKIGLSAAQFQVVSLKDLPYALPPCEETGTTFKENAMLKVAHTRRHLKKHLRNAIIIGDDSGVCLPALRGKPGVYTRRWLGYEMSDEAIIAHCLSELSGKDRTAYYMTAYAISLPNRPETYVYEDYTRAVVLESPNLESYLPGIPFRALLFVPELKMMFHKARELSPARRKGLHFGHEDILSVCRKYILSSYTRTPGL